MGGSTKSVVKPSPKARLELSSPRFEVREIAAEVGLTAANVYGGVTTKKHILEMTGNGIAIADFDNDGWRDLLFINGTRIGAARPEPNRLHRELAADLHEVCRS